MSQTRSIAVLVGSLRAASLNRKMAHALVARAPQTLACRVVEIGDLALYNEDLEKDPPPAWLRFRAEMREADAVLFVTPEYNRGVPGGLKNAIDVGSRPYGQSVFEGRPAAVVSVSPGKIGGFGANHALRQSLVFLDMPALQQPEAYIGGAGGMFDDDGALNDGATADFLAKFMNTFAKWIETLRAG